MKTLITGSNGCVGSALKALLHDNRDWNFVSRTDCDLSNKNETITFFKKVSPDYVIHLASYVPGFYQINAVNSFSSNILINENVLGASHQAGVQKGLFTLSVNMFPESSQAGFPLKEFSMLEGSLAGPFRGYGYAKRMLALSLENYNKQYGTKYWGLIPTNIYGPHDNFKSGRLIPNLITKFQEAIKNNTDVEINGTGKPLRQFIYSMDLARIIKHLVFNYTDTMPVICSSDEEVSIAELAQQIGQVMNFKGKIEFDPTKLDGVFKKTVSNSYLKSLMPNLQFTSLATGLTETISTRESK